MKRYLSWFTVLCALTGLPLCASNSFADAAKALDHKLDAPLVAAVMGGKADDVRSLLKRGADPNAMNPDDSHTPVLCLAASIGEPVAVTNALIEGGASLESGNVRGDSPLDCAALVGNVSTIEALLKAGAKIEANADLGLTPLIFAAAAGKTEAVRALLKAGANVNAHSNDGGTPLTYGCTKTAATTGNLPTVKLLVAADADVGDKNNDGKTAHDLAVASDLQDIAAYIDAVRQHDDDLCEAASQGKWADIKAALAAGASPRYHTRFYEDEGDEVGTLATVALLLKSPAVGFDEAVASQMLARSDLEAHDTDGNTPLLTAVVNRDLVMTRLLLKAGAKPNAVQTATGETPLMIAAQYGTLEMAKLLVDAGARQDIKTPKGETAASFGRGNVYKDVQQFFANGLVPAAKPDEDLPNLADALK